MTFKKISVFTATALVVANMIGTGVFTSIGFQLVEIKNPTAILLLWITGGILALSGAFSYAEIATIIKKSGGEYTYLKEIFSPLLGFLAGWVSLTVGFAAPVALSAIAVVSYFPYGELNPVVIGIILVAIITAIHSVSLQSSASFQNSSTLLKLLLIVGLIVLGLWQQSEVNTQFHTENLSVDIFSSAFAIALIYVSYAYSGWNAAVYITEEFKNPKKSLLTALVGGTVLVTVLYTLLQFVFLKQVPIAELAGKVEVGAIVARKMLGPAIGNHFSFAISLLLISGISAMIWVGPRVTAAMAIDFSIWQFFGLRKKGIPVRALWLQFAITAGLLITGTFEEILIYCGFLLTVSSMLTVSGLFILRLKRKAVYQQSEVFKSPLFPLFQIIFILFSFSMIIFTFMEKPMEALIGTANLLIGGTIFFADSFLRKNNNL